MSLEFNMKVGTTIDACVYVHYKGIEQRQLRHTYTSINGREVHREPQEQRCKFKTVKNGEMKVENAAWNIYLLVHYN